MNYVSAKGNKLKGSAVAASGKHVDRAVHTPNADPEKSAENVHLIGGDIPLEESVKAIINQYGGKPRSDSVECLEFVLTASSKFFEKSDGSPNPEKIKAFADASMTFINDDTKYGKCVKAVLHLDEMTPHLHVHKVPIDPKGKLNCKHHFGSKAQGVKFQNEMYEIYKHLGLQRGIPNSRAEYMSVRDFYKELKKEFDLSVDVKKLPEPPRTMLMEAAREEYKKIVSQAVLAQIEPKIRVMNFQATQTRNEKSRREALERQFHIYKHEAANKVQLRQNEIRAVERRSLQLEKTLELRQQEIVDLRDRLAEKESEGKRIADIPAHEILQKIGLPLKEAKPGIFVYFDKKNGRHLVAADNQLQEANGKILSRNAMQTVALIRRAGDLTVLDKHQENLECGKLLVRLFGEDRGQAAVLHAYRDIHRQDIKEYKMELQTVAVEKNGRQKTGGTNSHTSKDGNDKSRDKNRDRDWTHSR